MFILNVKGGSAKSSFPTELKQVLLNNANLCPTHTNDVS